MGLIVEPDVWTRLPGLRVVAVLVRGLDNARPVPACAERLDEAQASLRAGWGYPNAQSHPAVAAWREAFARIGLSGKKYPSSIEALCRRVLSGQRLRSINPLVDYYNAVSLEHVVPVGGWDLAALGDDDVRLGVSSGGELFRELGRDDVEPVGPNEISYLVRQHVITRHFVWRQSDLGKITPTTGRALLVSEILPSRDDALVPRVRAALVDGLRDLLGGDPISTVVRADQPRWSWADR